MAKLTVRLLLLAVLVAGIAACGTTLPPIPSPAPTSTPRPTRAPTATPRPTPTPPPTPTPVPVPTLQGGLIIEFTRPLTATLQAGGSYDLSVENEEGLIHLQAGADGRIAATVLVTEMVIGPVVSPDRRHLLYIAPLEQEAGIAIRRIDLDSRAVSTVLQFSETTVFEFSDEPIIRFKCPSCLAWAPDSQRFSYIFDHALYVHNLAIGETVMIVQAPSQEYSLFGLGDGNVEYGELGCAGWVGPDHLLFQRFAGPMPFSITWPNNPELRANATTLADLTQENALFDASARLTVLAAAEDGQAFVLSREGASGQNTLEVTRPFTRFAVLESRSLPSGSVFTETDHFLFLPGGRGLVAVQPTPLTFFRLDPETLLEQGNFVYPESWSMETYWPVDAGNEQNADAPFVWADTEKNIIAFKAYTCSELLPDRCEVEVRIGDLETSLWDTLWQPSGDFVDVRLVAWLPPATGVAEPADVTSGHIALMTNRDGNLEIYLVNADGSNPQNLTGALSDEGKPTWSPDGRRIAFESNRSGDIEIYVMNADGSAVSRLTQSPGSDYGPAWSSAGERIAFRSDRDGNPEIYVMNADGSGALRLTDNSAVDDQPTWSPNGERIVFVSNRDGNWELYIMNADGSGVIRLTSDPYDDVLPSWSPDGQTIAFASNRDGNYELYRIRPDGTELTRLTFDPADDLSPAWSPDGGRIAFVSGRDGNGNIYVMSADGSAVTRATDDPADEQFPAWMP